MYLITTGYPGLFAQSTIKVNLLLKVLLKLIVNYFCCTNVN